jgi:CubicO group peptidase (beta-lactamase class C family)
MVIQNGEYNGVRIAKPATIALMKTDQLPLNLGVSFSQEDNPKNYGFTFGYGIKRREVEGDPATVGTISWGGSTGPTFFIDLKHEMVAMVMYQTPMTFPVEIRNNFSNWMMKSLVTP